MARGEEGKALGGAMADTAPAIAEVTPPQPPPPLISREDRDLYNEVLRLRASNQRLIDELKEKQRIGPSYTTARHVSSAPMPANYVVWIGPDPIGEVELCLSAKGRVETFPDLTPVTMKDGDGQGKERTISKTTNIGLTGKYIDQGFTSIEFRHRCPPRHKYAGRPWATIYCPEHAAWLSLTAGKDRDGNKMFAWFLHPKWAADFHQLKRYRLNRMRMEQMEVEEIMETGQEMPMQDEGAY